MTIASRQTRYRDRRGQVGLIGRKIATLVDGGPVFLHPMDSVHGDSVSLAPGRRDPALQVG